MSPEWARLNMLDRMVDVISSKFLPLVRPTMTVTTTVLLFPPAVLLDAATADSLVSKILRLRDCRRGRTPSASRKFSASVATDWPARALNTQRDEARRAHAGSGRTLSSRSLGEGFVRYTDRGAGLSCGSGSHGSMQAASWVPEAIVLMLLWFCFKQAGRPTHYEMAEGRDWQPPPAAPSLIQR